MMRFRALSFVALCISLAISYYGYGNFNPEVQITGWWLVLGVAGTIMAISALSLMCLSFFALEPASDGAFVMRKDSFYGKLFLAFSSIGPYESMDEVSYCRSFWQTNLAIFLICFMLAVLITAGAFLLFGFWNPLTNIGIVLLGVFIVAAAVAILIGIVYGVARAGIVSFGFLSNTQFGKEFDGIYHNYLCPRIRVEP